METASVASDSGIKQAGSSFIKDNCGCATEDNIHTACSIFGKTVAGLGVGVVSGISLVVLAAAAEVAVPALLVLKAFGLTGGAFGFLKGIKKD
jgi:hypothetical protein